jgi:hypothetical protein
MDLAQRLRPAVVASGAHLIASIAVALCSAVLVFGLWYPFPYRELAGGRDLFFIMIAVDVVCGPLLTLIVFNPGKPKIELWRDLSIVVLLQLVALAYGLYSVTQARPLFMAFEGDRFRVVCVPDVQLDKLAEAAPEFQTLSLSGPRLIGARLAKNTDPDFPQSVQLSLAGVPPAFRPERWVPYEAQRQAVTGAAKTIGLLRKKHPGAAQMIDETVAKSGVSEERLGFLPLVSLKSDEWVAVVDLDSAIPRGYLPLSAW